MKKYRANVIGASYVIPVKMRSQRNIKLFYTEHNPLHHSTFYALSCMITTLMYLIPTVSPCSL